MPGKHSDRPFVRNAFLKYALQVTGLSRYVSLGQLGSVWVSSGQVGPSGCQLGSTGVNREQRGASGVKRDQ